MALALYLIGRSLIRYLAQDLEGLTRSRLQLVGVAAMLVASKYEEIFAPEVT